MSIMSKKIHTCTRVIVLSFHSTFLLPFTICILSIWLNMNYAYLCLDQGWSGWSLTWHHMTRASSCIKLRFTWSTNPRTPRPTAAAVPLLTTWRLWSRCKRRPTVSRSNPCEAKMTERIWKIYKDLWRSERRKTFSIKWGFTEALRLVDCCYAADEFAHAVQFLEQLFSRDKVKSLMVLSWFKVVETGWDFETSPVLKIILGTDRVTRSDKPLLNPWTMTIYWQASEPMHHSSQRWPSIPPLPQAAQLKFWKFGICRIRDSCHGVQIIQYYIVA